MRTTRTAVSLALASAAAACAGASFVRPTPDAFTLGKTTQEQVVQQLGTPAHRGTIRRNDASFETITYAYMSSFGALEEGVVPHRQLLLIFSNGVLVGEEYSSSFKADHTHFDEAKLASVVKGETTRADVIRLLGAPSCRFIPPAARSGVKIGYLYRTTRGGPVHGGYEHGAKYVELSFDDRDRVADVELTIARPARPPPQPEASPRNE